MPISDNNIINIYVIIIIINNFVLLNLLVIKQQSNFQSFQAVCIIVAFLSWLLMRYTGMNVQVAVEACNTNNTPNQGINLLMFKCTNKTVDIINGKGWAGNNLPTRLGLTD